MGNCVPKSSKDIPIDVVASPPLAEPPEEAFVRQAETDSAANEADENANENCGEQKEEAAARAIDILDDDDDECDCAIEITETTVPSTIPNDPFAIPIKTFVPASKQRIRAAALFVHGGIFSLGDRHCHPTISKSLASKLGLVVVTASFRNGEEAPNESDVTRRDLRDVIDYVRRRSEKGGLGLEGVPFGLVGSSSGGFFALNLAQTLAPSIPISFCIPICPVADPYKRASYLRSSISGTAQSDGYGASSHDPAQSKFMLEKQLSFWKNDESMMEAGSSLKSNARQVPTLLILGSEDKNVPFAVTNDVMSWATRTVVIGGKGHELCDEVVEGGGYHCYLGDIDRFLEYCLSREQQEKVLYKNVEIDCL